MAVGVHLGDRVELGGSPEDLMAWLCSIASCPVSALSRAGRYREAAAGLRVKEVRISEGESLVVCYNPESAERHAAVCAPTGSTRRHDCGLGQALRDRTRRAAKGDLDEARAGALPARDRGRALARGRCGHKGRDRSTRSRFFTAQTLRYVDCRAEQLRNAGVRVFLAAFPQRDDWVRPLRHVGGRTSGARRRAASGQSPTTCVWRRRPASTATSRQDGRWCSSYSVTVRSMPLYHCLDMAVREPFSCICCTA